MTVRVLLFAVATLVQVAPHEAPATLGAEARRDYSIVRNFIVRAAEKMPDRDYDFRPTSEIRTFGQLIGHIADDQYRYCAAARGEAARPSSLEQTAPPKDVMVQALKAAFAYCDSTYDAITNASALDPAVFSGRRMPTITVLTLHAGHAWEHYGNVVIYMRLRGLVPPSSEPGPQEPS